MKLYKNSLARSARVITITSVVGGALFAAPALQAQYTGVTPPQSQQQTPAPAGASHELKEFLQFASQANQTEMAMANVAESKAQNASVKDLAQMMLKDHQQNYAQVQQIARDHLVALDAALDHVNQRAVNHLRDTRVADFDKTYAKTMLRDHVKVIKRFDQAIAELKEPYATEYAQNTLTDLRKHLKHSEDAARAVGLDESTIMSILKGLPGNENGAISFNAN